MGQVETCEEEVPTTETLALLSPKKKWTRRNLVIKDVVNGVKLRKAKRALGIYESDPDDEENSIPSHKRPRQGIRAAEDQDAIPAKCQRMKHSAVKASDRDPIPAKCRRTKRSTVKVADPIPVKRRRIMKVPFDPSDRSVDAAANAGDSEETSGCSNSVHMPDRRQKRRRLHGHRCTSCKAPESD